MSIARHLLLLPLLVLLVGCGDRAATGPASRRETAGLDRAVALALEAFDEDARHADEPYRLTAAKQMIADGRWIWRVTFEADKHLPADPGKDLLTAGGEIFVNVDLQTEEATVRYGE